MLYKTGFIEEAEALARVIPQGFITELNAFEYGENTIATQFACNIPREDGYDEFAFIGCKWGCAPHIDRDFPKWSHLLVLRNLDRGFAVRTVDMDGDKNEDVLLHQPVGTLLTLNVHEHHWVTPAYHKPVHDPLWIALTYSTEKWARWTDIMRVMKQAVEHLL